MSLIPSLGWWCTVATKMFFFKSSFSLEKNNHSSNLRVREDFLSILKRFSNRLLDTVSTLKAGPASVACISPSLPSLWNGLVSLGWWSWRGVGVSRPHWDCTGTWENNQLKHFQERQVCKRASPRWVWLYMTALWRPLGPPFRTVNTWAPWTGADVWDPSVTVLSSPCIAHTLLTPQYWVHF